MALDLKILVQPDVNGGRYLWVTDKTGAYDDTSNTGGWGNPNQELNQSALAALIIRQSETPSQLEAVSSDVFYDSNAAATKETVFQFTFVADGWHDVTLFRLPVSNDGATTLEGASLSEGDYFYYASTNKVSKLSSSSVVEVDDYSEMLEDDSILQVTCERIFLLKLAIYRNDMYWDYKELRNKEGRCKETDEIFRRLDELTQDIMGAMSAFWSGNKIEAHSLIESLLVQHDLSS